MIKLVSCGNIKWYHIETINKKWEPYETNALRNTFYKLEIMISLGSYIKFVFGVSQVKYGIILKRNTYYKLGIRLYHI